MKYKTLLMLFSFNFMFSCSLNNKIGIDNCGGNALKCITNTGH